MIRVLLILLVLVLIAPPLLLLLLSATPKVEVDQTLSAIGTSTPVKIRISDPHGVRHISAWVEQNGTRYPVYNQTRPSTRILFFKQQKPEDVTFQAGTKTAAALKDGKARLIAEVTSNDLRGSTAEDTRDINVITRPPSVTADGAQHYLNQGGAELVTFSVQGFWTEAGEKSGPYTFRSFALPGKEGQRFSLFAYPWDLPPTTAPFVYARNPAGNESVAHFWFKVFPKKFRKRDLPIDDAFLNKVVPDIDPNGSGDLLARFLKSTARCAARTIRSWPTCAIKRRNVFFGRVRFCG